MTIKELNEEKPDNAGHLLKSWLAHGDGSGVSQYDYENINLSYASCSKTGSPCRHVSIEKIRNVQRVGVLKTGKIERRESIILLGERCNNDGRCMVSELRECPIPAALAVPLVPFEISPLEWMRRRYS